MPAEADVIELLARARLFEGLTAGDLETLRPAVRMRTFAKDSHVFREGDAGSHLYLVKSGQVKIAPTRSKRLSSADQHTSRKSHFMWQIWQSHPCEESRKR